MTVTVHWQLHSPSYALWSDSNFTVMWLSTKYSSVKRAKQKKVYDLESS